MPWSFWRPAPILKLSKGPQPPVSSAHKRHSSLWISQGFYVPGIGDKDQTYVFLIVWHPPSYLLTASSSSFCSFPECTGFGTSPELIHRAGGLAAVTCHLIILGNGNHFAVGHYSPTPFHSFSTTVLIWGFLTNIFTKFQRIATAKAENDFKW